MGKKYTLGLAAVLFVILLPHSANTSNVLETTLFPVRLTVNDARVEISPALPILNYEGTTYVPLRNVVEHLKGGVYYEPSDNSVQVQLNTINQVQSRVTSLTDNGDFKLSLHSAKEVYAYGEPLQVWSALTYTGEQELPLVHGKPAIIFTITDPDGELYGEPQHLVGQQTTFRQGDVYLAQFPWETIMGMNFAQSGMEDWYAFVGQTKSWLLKTGTYTIGAEASVWLEDKEQVKVHGKISITVQPPAP